jgi:hypothetical protein
MAFFRDIPCRFVRWLPVPLNKRSTEQFRPACGSLRLSTLERKYDDVSYSTAVLASVTTENKEQEMPVQEYVIELMNQSTKRQEV